MALTVEDGTGIGTADSYVSLADAELILASHPDTPKVWLILTTEGKEHALIEAAKWLDAKFRFYGWARTSTQALQWPRTKNYDEKGTLMPAGTIPPILKRAQAMVAIAWVKNGGLYNLITEGGVLEKFATPGLDLGFANNQKLDVSVEGKRMPEVELMLKNMGDWNDMEWFKTTRTVTRGQ